MTRISPFILVGMTLLMAAPAFGAAAPVRPPPQPADMFQRSMFYEQDVRERLEAAMPTEQKLLVEWGGFYIPSYVHFTDINDNHGDLTVQDLRLWTQIKFDEVHRIFARMRLNYIDFAPGDGQGLRDHDLVGPNLEIGYYELNVSQAAMKYGGQKWPFNMYIRGGRQYIEVGRGIAMANILDAGQFEVDTKDWSFMGFAGHSPRGQDAIERFGPRFDTTRRAFFGGQFNYLAIDGHQPYAFFVIQKPMTDDGLPTQDFDYDSSYYGVGSKGSVAKNLNYAVESLWEFGNGAANTQVSGTEQVRAYAFNAELDYYVQAPLKPVLAAEYGYASGDSDRGTAISALNGNRIGTSDREFQGFGYVNTGLALASSFSNLQFVRLGGKMTPYEKKTGAGRVDVGLDYYFLFKANDDGPTSDFRAVNDATSVGNEVDIFLEWRIFSDLSWTIRYAHFFPGAAYDDRHGRDFLYTGLNFSF
ncbi:MAG: alginate export family protein [Planctomycetota bacterium]|nr:alginate export family protein [Planctomycetota bacterium]